MKLYYITISKRLHILKAKLNKNNIAHESVRLQGLTPSFIIDLLIKSENGYEDIIVKNEETEKLMDEMTVKQLAKYLSKHMELLKPIICVGNGKLISGNRKVEEYRELL
jgi:arsenate reductase-like glutaredoxin family protein